MSHHTESPLRFATIAGQPVHADFDAGVLSSDGGVLWLRTLETRLGVLRQLSEVIVDRCHPSYIEHAMTPSSVNASSRLPVTTKMPMIATLSVMTRCSKPLATASPSPANPWPRNSL